ncbi:hypothetical protein [Synechococcus sp. CC9616]|uniref:hypothetical protein n=1 Tax=Synechococcus sp. CC9616 TaxID=110663 RepID=UPI000491DE8D|nr:hypothetical protein [Synechococcus sp. CC9616]
MAESNTKPAREKQGAFVIAAIDLSTRIQFLLIIKDINCFNLINTFSVSLRLTNTSDETTNVGDASLCGSVVKQSSKRYVAEVFYVLRLNSSDIKTLYSAVTMSD